MSEEMLFDMSSISSDQLSNFVTVAKTGNFKNEYPFSRIKFSPNKKIRFALLTSDVIVLKRHYMEGLNYFLCTGGKCCEVAKKQGTPCYIYPAVLYTQCDDKGKLSGDEIEVRVLIANKEMYNNLVAFNEIKGSIVSYDLLGVQDNTTGRFPKTTFFEAGAISWKTPENVAKVKEYFEKYKDKLIESVAKVVSDEKLDEILNAQKEEGSCELPGTVTAETSDEIDKIFGLN